MGFVKTLTGPLPLKILSKTVTSLHVIIAGAAESTLLTKGLNLPNQYNHNYSYDLIFFSNAIRVINSNYYAPALKTGYDVPEK